MTGVYSMSVTPFDRDGEVDERLFRAHLRFQADAGVGVYVASQGSGEGDLLTFDEKVKLYNIAADELRGRVPVIAAGIGLAASTAMTCSLAAAAEAAAVDAVQIIGPRPGPLRLRDDELEGHFRSVIESVRCDVHVSNNVALAGYALPVDLVARLVDDYPHVRVVNVSDPRLDDLYAYVSGLVDRFGRRVEVRVGMVREIVAMYALGARGVLCFEPNVAPRIVTKVWQELAEGLNPDVGALLHLNAALARGGNPRSLKAALKIIGRGGGFLRAPYLGLTDEDVAVLEQELGALGVGP
jgi:4-hydroxy-tetrahydrodipicolinate synthase